MASSLRDTIQHLASSFAAGVLDAIRGSSLEDILAETEGGARRGPGRPPKNPLLSAIGGGGRRRGRPAGRGGSERLGRRSANDLAKVVDRIVDLLASNPKGLRAEQIRDSLGLSSKEMPRPIAKALASRRITKTGEKRATTYYAGKGGATSSGAKRSSGRRRGRPAGKKSATRAKKGGKSRGSKRGRPAKKAAAAAAAVTNGAGATST